MTDTNHAADPGQAAPHEPVEPGTNRRHTWAQFTEAGMLWWTNRILHMFGWVIVLEKSDDGQTLAAHPARTEWRGFPRDREEIGYTRVAAWMEKAARSIREETER